MRVYQSDYSFTDSVLFFFTNSPEEQEAYFFSLLANESV